MSKVSWYVGAFLIPTMLTHHPHDAALLPKNKHLPQLTRQCLPLRQPSMLFEVFPMECTEEHEAPSPYPMSRKPSNALDCQAGSANIGPANKTTK